MFQGGHFPVDRSGTDFLLQAQGAVLVQHFHREGMNQGIAPHALEVGEVIMLGRHSPLVANKGQIPLNNE